MKKEKLYNVIFPIWLMILIPPIILSVIPANFIIDSLVLLLGLKISKVTDKFKNYKKCILKVWIFGFLIDIAGSLLLFATQVLGFSSFLSDNLIEPLMWNPFSNVFALLYAITVIALCGFLIYKVNCRFSFEKTNLDQTQKRFISILLAIITAPYLFLLPTSLFY